MSLNLDNSTWKRVAFGDVIENVTDRVDDPSEADVDRYVGLEHLDPGVMTVRRWDTPDKVEAQKLRFQPGDVIFGRRRAYQKKVALAEFVGICSAHALVLRARPDYIHPDFLPVFLSSDYFLDRAIAISVGSLSPTVNWRDLRVQEFHVPSLDDQKRIADLLWAVELCRLAAHEKWLGLARLRACWRARVFERPTESARMEECAEVTLGRQRAPQHATGNYMRDYVRSANIADGRVSLSDIKQMNFTPAEQAKFRLMPGDILVSEGTASPRELGSSAMWDPKNPNHEMYFQKTLIRLRARQGRSTPVLLREWAQWAQESGAFVGVATGTGILHITGVRCSAMPFPVLSDEDMRETESRAEELAGAARAAHHEIEQLGRLRSVLLGDIFESS